MPMARTSPNNLAVENPGQRLRARPTSLETPITQARNTKVSNRKRNRIGSGALPQSGLTTKGMCPHVLLRLTKLDDARKTGWKKFTPKSAQKIVAQPRHHI